MATYSTDLTTLTTAESGTWAELTGTILGFTLSGAGSPSIDTENYIQGTNCYSQTTGKAQDAEISIVFDYGSGYTFATDEVVFGWCFYAVGANLKTKANSGWMFVICDSLTTGDYFIIGGSDSGRNPYGGWTNVAIDPTATQSGTLGSGGNGDTYRYFGQVCNTIGEISKGTPSGVDAIRAGRGVISVTGSSGTFAELASYNDYNGGSTPPGTSSTSVDSGYHRLGLFQESSGVFLWKGLLSLGTAASSVTFSDSNATIIIDDCPHTYPSFNKLEVNNASSSVTSNNITLISTASTANGIGHFEMVADATFTCSGWSCNDMGTFVFDSNSTITTWSFNGCGQVTQGGGTITNCAFNGSTAAVALVADNLSLVTGCTFASSGTGHAVNLGTISSSQSVAWNNTHSGYAIQTGTAANRTILVNVASGQTLTINVAATAGGGNPSYYNTGSGTVSVVAGQKTFSFTVSPSITGYEWRMYSVTALGSLAGSSELDGEETATSDNQSYQYTYSSDINLAVQIIDDDYEESITYYVMGNSDQDVTIKLSPEENT